MKLAGLIGLFLICTYNGIAQEKFISVGSGGGFAGTVTTYKIIPNGKVFKGSGLGDIKFTECGKIKKSAAKKFVSAVADQTRLNTSFSHPGNLYYFIRYTENGKEQTITWGDADHPVPADVKKLYEEIQASVTVIRYKPVK
ncbi:MAG TPA: hypothetical protein VGK59_22120 [Ohtaekwangia sp.]